MAALDLFGPASAPGAVTNRPADSRTFGAVDTFFQDCSSDTAEDGTEFQAAWFNQVLANWRALARGNGTTGAGAKVVTEDNADDTVLLKAVQQLIQRGQSTFAVDQGSVGHVTAAFAPAVVEHKLGIRLWVKIANTNTGDADFAPNGLTAVPIKRLGGGTLQPGDLQGGAFAELAYDGTVYQIVSTLGSGGSTAKAPKLIGFMAGTTGQILPYNAGATMSWNTLPYNGLTGTSTFDGTTLTVGAGEAGLWFFYNQFGYEPSQNAGAGYLSAFIYKNGVGAIATDSYGPLDAGHVPLASSHNMVTSGIVKVAAGDTITAVGFQTAVNGTIVTSASSGKFQGFLIGSY